MQLAQAFTAALNAHDVDTLVNLFADEDAGATVMADRYAWNKFEIRLWAQQEARANIRMDADDSRSTEQGANWNALVSTDDLRRLGLDSLQVTDTLWIRNGKLANLAMEVRDPCELDRLGHLWQPGAVPDRPNVSQSN